MRQRAVGVTVAVAAALAMALPAYAQDGQGPSICSEVAPGGTGQLISNVAQTVGHSGTLNPGNAQSDFPPFVPFFVGCNPTDNPGPRG
jgi:hypothetical protein